MNGGAPLSEVLRAGLGWLDMEQPHGAIQTHHGVGGGVHWGGRISVRLCPRGWADLPVVVFNVIGYVWHPEHLANPLTLNEVARLARVVALAGRPVRLWNGVGSGSLSVAVDHARHPTLDGALDTCRAGCPAHPRHILCGWAPPNGLGCPWYRTGHRLMRYPAGWGH